MSLFYGIPVAFKVFVPMSPEEIEEELAEFGEDDPDEIKGETAYNPMVEPDFLNKYSEGISQLIAAYLAVRLGTVYVTCEPDFVDNILVTIEEVLPE